MTTTTTLTLRRFLRESDVQEWAGYAYSVFVQMASANASKSGDEDTGMI